MDDGRNEFYARRIGRAVDYIKLNLDGELSVQRLAEVAGFSKYHFHRQFRAVTGTTVARLVALLRLRRASYQLAFEPTRSIIWIAQAAGFANPESFSRAFRAAQAQSPSEFRRAPNWEHWTQAFQSPIPRNLETRGTHPMNAPNDAMTDIRIVNFETTPIAALEHHGPPGTLMNTVGRFIEWRKSCSDAPEARSRTFGIAYASADTPPEDFRWDVCASLTGELSPNTHGVVAKTIPGGRCAVLRHHGSTDRLRDSINTLYARWLPNSDEEPRDFPLFFHYIARAPRVEEHEQITDIYLPLK